MQTRKFIPPYFPFHPGKWPFFYGWMILVWGTLGMVMSIPGQTIGVSAFTEYLLKELAIDRNQLSIAYMAGTISSSLLLPLAGRWYDRLGSRLMASLAAFFLAMVLLYLSQVDKVAQFLTVREAWLPAFTLFFVFLGFFLLRFFGQGVLTMASKNMMVKWWERKRGFATGFSNVAVSLLFSLAPAVITVWIHSLSWRGAWQLLALIGFIFAVMVLIFYRDDPQKYDMVPDGQVGSSDQKVKIRFPVVRHFGLKRARRTYSFWIFALFMAMQGLYITGFTFHVVSVFDGAGLDKETAIRIFQPTAIVSVVVTLLASNFSDYLRIKYLLYIKGLGAVIGILGLINLGNFEAAYIMLFTGNGIMMGLFAVLTTVTWPRYFGVKYLGAITGQAVMMIVFGSALGPILFSLSQSELGSYQPSAWVCLAIFGLLTLLSFRADNPQEKLSVTTGDGPGV